MDSIDLYHKYHKYQAQNHTDLQHDDASGSRVFEQINVEESFGDFRTGVKEKDFIMRLIEPTFNIYDEVQKLTGGFIIARYHSDRKDGKNGYNNALIESERVMGDIVRRIIADSQDGHPLFCGSLDSKQDFSFQIVNVTGDGSYTGLRVIYSFDVFFDNCQDAAAYIDGGQTPHVL